MNVLNRCSCIPALFTALVVVGCAAGAPATVAPKKDAPVPLSAKLKQVQSLTKTVSLAQNAGLSKATSSLSKNQGLVTAFQSLQQVASLLAGLGLGAAKGAMPPVKALTKTQADAQASSLKASYALAASIQQSGATLIYDDATHELTGVQTPDVTLALSFQNTGRTRSWQAKILSARDGTTGQFSIEVTGDWKPQAGAIELPGDRSCDAPATGCAPTPLPFKVFGGDQPSAIEAMKLHLSLTPAGNEGLALALDGTFDDPQPVLYVQDLKAPMHWAMKASLPQLALDWDSHAAIKLGDATFNATGNLVTTTDTGSSRYTYSLGVSEATKAGHLDLVSPDAQVKLALDASYVDGLPQYSSQLLSLDDNTVLGTIALDPARPRFAVITLKDGSKQDWELYPDGLLPQPPAAPQPAPFPRPL